MVTNALTLKDQMQAAFDEVLARSGSASTVTVSSGSLQTNTLLFQASFNTNGWTGLVKAIDFSSGTVGGTEWEFSDQVRTQLARTNGHDTNREIITMNTSGKGVPFRFPASYASPTSDEISSSQVTGLLSGISSSQQSYGEDLLNYIRGDNSEESGVTGASRSFRERQGDGGHKAIGDVVHSDPLYVTAPGFFFPDDWPTTLGGYSATARENTATQKYSTYRTLLKDREPVLYVGANDGMLHAINAYKNGSGVTDGGEEILAYVPSNLYDKLPNLADQNYNHEYFVDGKTTYSDAFFSGDSKWHTALVGTLNGGGQGVYALDISDPKGVATGYDSFDEGNAEDLALWEFTDSDDADLGFTFGRPTVVRLANGEWGAIFSNGYDNTESDGTVSTTGNAAVYIVNIETGALIKKFDTEQGLLDDPNGAGRPNGMSEAMPVDIDGDFIADYIYAGDLFGNMWKIDISSVNDSNWGFSFSHSGSPAPLYVATSALGNRLPITQRPLVRSHPKFGGIGQVLVAFGTGQYIEDADNTALSQETQSFFGVWDDGSNSFSRSDLLVQTISEVTQTDPASSYYNQTFRSVSSNPIFWEDQLDAGGSVIAVKHGGWVVDLLDSSAASPANGGERSVSNAALRGENIVLTTLIPSDDPCLGGGSSWLMVIDSQDGSQPDSSFIDLNDDNAFNEADLVDTDGDGVGDTIVSGMKSNTGILSTSTFIDNNDDGNSLSINAVSDDSTLITTMQLNAIVNKRLFWRELQ